MKSNDAVAILVALKRFLPADLQQMTDGTKLAAPIPLEKRPDTCEQEVRSNLQAAAVFPPGRLPKGPTGALWLPTTVAAVLAKNTKKKRQMQRHPVVELPGTLAIYSGLLVQQLLKETSEERKKR